MISGAAVASKGAQNGHDIYNYDTNYTYNPFATVGSSSFSPSKDKRPRGNYRSRPYKNVRQSYTTRKPKSSENNNPQISETPSPAEALILKHQSLREEDYKLECTQKPKSCRINLLMGPKLYLDEIINPSKL